MTDPVDIDNNSNIIIDCPFIGHIVNKGSICCMSLSFSY